MSTLHFESGCPHVVPIRIPEPDYGFRLARRDRIRSRVSSLFPCMDRKDLKQDRRLSHVEEKRNRRNHGLRRAPKARKKRGRKTKPRNTRNRKKPRNRKDPRKPRKPRAKEKPNPRDRNEGKRRGRTRGPRKKKAKKK